MTHRIQINEHSKTEIILGKARVSSDGILELPDFSKIISETFSDNEKRCANIWKSSKVITMGRDNTLCIMSDGAYKRYVENIAKEIDVNPVSGRKFLRFFTANAIEFETADELKLPESFWDYIKINFDNNSCTDVIISFHPGSEDEKADYYSIINPERTKRLILLSASLMAKVGRNLVKDALEYLGLKTNGKKIVIIFSRKKESDKEYEKAYIRGCKYLGFFDEDIILSDDIGDDDQLREIIAAADFIYATDGNVYDTLNYIHKRNLAETIRESVKGSNKAVYIGSSAGAAVAGKDINLVDFSELDHNKVGLASDYFAGIGLFDGTIIPHYNFDDHLENLKNTAITNGKENMLNSYKIILRVGNEETIIL